MFRFQPYRQMSVEFRLHPKLSVRYFGPFKVVKAISKVAYLMDLPKESKFHPIFYVSKLKAFKGENPKLVEKNIPGLICKNKVLTISLAILEKRTVLEKENPVVELLVQWEGLPPEETTWERMEKLVAAFPSTDLVDKVFSMREGDDRLTFNKEEILQDVNRRVELDKDEKSGEDLPNSVDDDWRDAVDDRELDEDDVVAAALSDEEEERRYNEKLEVINEKLGRGKRTRQVPSHFGDFKMV